MCYGVTTSQYFTLLLFDLIRAKPLKPLAYRRRRRGTLAVRDR